ncbi:hypothetical protein [Streptomyces sp. NBC_00057]
MALAQPDERRHNWLQAVSLYHAQHRAENARRLQDKLAGTVR